MFHQLVAIYSSGPTQVTPIDINPLQAVLIIIGVILYFAIFKFSLTTICIAALLGAYGPLALGITHYTGKDLGPAVVVSVVGCAGLIWIDQSKKRR
jgi:hypothetical protein